MRLRAIEPPRRFPLGRNDIVISHVAEAALEADEQLTLVSHRGSEWDIVRKDWGYYATPSLNGRLSQHGLRAVLVRNAERRLYLLLVERGAEAAFEAYRGRESLELIHWLDDDEACERAATLLAG